MDATTDITGVPSTSGGEAFTISATPDLTQPFLPSEQTPVDVVAPVVVETAPPVVVAEPYPPPMVVATPPEMLPPPPAQVFVPSGQGPYRPTNVTETTIAPPIVAPPTSGLPSYIQPYIRPATPPPMIRPFPRPPIIPVKPTVLPVKPPVLVKPRPQPPGLVLPSVAMRPQNVPTQFTQGRPLSMKEAMEMARKMVAPPSPKLTGAPRAKALRDYELMINKVATRLVQESRMQFMTPPPRRA
jgi:hypothetical protein